MFWQFKESNNKYITPLLLFSSWILPLVCTYLKQNRQMKLEYFFTQNVIVYCLTILWSLLVLIILYMPFDNFKKISKENYCFNLFSQQNLTNFLKDRYKFRGKAVLFYRIYMFCLRKENSFFYKACCSTINDKWSNCHGRYININRVDNTVQ